MASNNDQSASGVPSSQNQLSVSEVSTRPAPSPARSLRKIEMELLLRRRVYTVEMLHEFYPPLKRLTLGGHIRKTLTCSRLCLLNWLKGLVPIITVISRYKITNLVPDILAGLSTAFLHLPQGLGFGILASLDPSNGLNTTFFSIVLYMVFGTSQHVSYGTNSLMAILTADVIEAKSDSYARGANVSLSAAEWLEFRVGISQCVMFVVGMLMLIMGLCHMGCLTNYLSISFIGGFTFSAAIHIITAQVPKMLNVEVKGIPAKFKVSKTYIECFKNISKANFADITIATVSAVIMLGVTICVNDKYRDRMPAPVPIDLIIVIAGTVISHFADLEKRYGIGVVGEVPAGFPEFRSPVFAEIPSVLSGSLVTGLLSFALTIALAKHLSKVHDYDLDCNQELVAYGMTNVVGAFFQGFPGCNSPPRAMVLSAMNAQTTLHGVPAALFILMVVLVAGPLFRPLPISILGAMMAVGMKDLLLQARQLRMYWNVSKADFLIWIVTAGMGVAVSMELGVVIGILVSFVTVVLFNQVAQGNLMGYSTTEDLLVTGTNRYGVSYLPGLMIFHFNSQLFFANAEFFKQQIYKKVFDPSRHNPALMEEYGTLEGRVHYILLDCSSMTYLDVAGLNMLKLIITQYGRVDSTVLLSDCPPYMLEVLRKADFFDHFDAHHLFYSAYDAYAWAKRRLAFFQRMNLHGPSMMSMGPPSATAGLAVADEGDIDDSVSETSLVPVQELDIWA